MTPQIVDALFFVYMVLAILGFFWGERIFQAIRRKCPEIYLRWQDGNSKDSLNSSASFAVFVFKGRVSSIEDRFLRIEVIAFRFLTYALVVLIVFLMTCSMLYRDASA